MLNISLSTDAKRALHAFLDKEDGAACFRLREFGSGCVYCRNDFHRVLRVTIDVPEESDLTAVVDGMPFVMEDLLLANYGNSFFIFLGQNRMPMVTALRVLLH
jgi:hypothetical protein